LNLETTGKKPFVCGFVVPIAVDIGAASINTQPNAGTFAQQQALGTNKAATSLEAGTS